MGADAPTPSQAPREDPHAALEEARREADRYRALAEDAGRRRLREAEALSRLLERAELAERALTLARDELERRVEERTAELRASEAELRAFMGHFPGLAFMADADGAVVFANDAFRDLLGLDPARLVGRRAEEVVPAPFGGTLTARDVGVARGGEVLRCEESIGERTFLVHRFPIRAPNRSARMGALALDVTDAKRAEAERQRLAVQMEQAQRLESLGVLTGGIAHDFNNLLTSILANVAVLQDDLPAGGAAGDCLQDVEGAARTAAGLCRQMLAYSGQAPFVVESIDLGPLVRGMLQLLRSSVSRRFHLSLDVPDDLPRLRGDPTQLRQVVMNLVINAGEAMGDAGGTVTVAARLVQVDGRRLRGAVLGEALAPGPYVSLEVADTGVGMDEETRARIFEPFFSSKFPGRGLGLSAVLGIVRQFGGAIEVESRPREGSRFRVLLPPPPPESRAPASARPVSRPFVARARALVVDDEGAVRRALRRVLDRLGFEVEEAASGEEALAAYRAAEGAYDAVVLDLTMPGLDGVATLERLRALGGDAVFVVSSGHAPTEVARRFADAPPDAYLQKPFDLSEVRRCLRGALSAS